MEILIESSSGGKELLFIFFLECFMACFSSFDASLASLRLCLISCRAEWILK